MSLDMRPNLDMHLLKKLGFDAALALASSL